MIHTPLWLSNIEARRRRWVRRQEKITLVLGFLILVEIAVATIYIILK